MYSVLLNCKSAVSIRTVLIIPPVVAQWDRVFLVFPIVVINGMIFFANPQSSTVRNAGFAQKSRFTHGLAR